MCSTTILKTRTAQSLSMISVIVSVQGNETHLLSTRIKLSRCKGKSIATPTQNMQSARVAGFNARDPSNTFMSLHKVGRCLSHSNTSTTTLSLPVLNALNVELSKDLVDGGNEAIHLFSGVPGSDREPQPLLTASNGGIVDGSDVDSMVGKQGVRSNLY